jgi:ribulose-phosphate 3-epimerase
VISLSPSILSGDLLNLERQLDALRGLKNLHLDIDDGHFVRGISFGAALVGAIARYTDIPLDVHLEVANPCDYVDELCALRLERICAHLEALPYPSLFLSRAHRGGRAAGLALNLKTPVDAVLPYADQLDYLLLVSVEADCEGVVFRRGVLGKIRRAREILPSAIPVWVDGGINEATMRDIIDSGATGLVIGRTIFASADPAAEYTRLLAAAETMAREGGSHA